MRIALCDDEAEQIKFLRKLIASWSSDKLFDVAFTEYESAEEFIFKYPNEPCDLLLLDIEMKSISGMELAHKLRDSGDMLPIVFITGYSDYICEGYDVDALHYLLKPIDENKLFSVLDKYVIRHNQSDEILITSDDKTMHISVQSIAYIEAFGRNTAVHLFDGAVIKSKMNIGSFEKMGLFVCCHRSYLVNLRYVKSIDKTEIFLDSGEKIPISRRHFGDVSKRFIEYYTRGKT